jgi:hypothetical protein
LARSTPIVLEFLMALALCMVNLLKSSQDLGKRRSPYIVLS